MKIFIFESDRYKTTTTPSFFSNYFALVHNQEQYDAFSSAGTLDMSQTWITNQPKGLPYQRNFALDKMDIGEWAMFICDDLIGVEEYEEYDKNVKPDPLYPKDYIEISEEQFLKRCAESITKAEDIGAYLVGFSHYSNSFFRVNKWRTAAKVDGNCCLIKKSHLRYGVTYPRTGDWKFSIDNLEAFGTILMNNWIYVSMEKWTAGGQGTKDERRESRHEEIDRLIKQHPNHVKLGPKSTDEFKTLRQIKWTTRK